jgi:long-chain acyl-CoA synthetase
MTNREPAENSSPRPWLSHYEPRVPHQIDQRTATLGEVFAATAARFPDRPALLFPVRAAGRLFTSTMTYARLRASVERFAAGLSRVGVVKGDRVAIFMPNTPQFVIAYLATVRLGGIAVPFNPLYSAREAEHQLNDCGAKVAVVLDRFYPLITKARAKTLLSRVIVAPVKEYFTPTLKLLYTLTAERKQPKIRLAEGDLPFASLLGPGEAPPVAAHADETAVLLYTGGTTGVSKGVELSHRNLLVNAEQNRAWASLGERGEIALAALPLFHAFGLTCCLNLGLLIGATTILVPNPTDTTALLETIHRHRPTIFPVVPTLLSAMLIHPRIDRYDLTSVRVSPCAGSPLPVSLQEAFIARTGMRPVEGYGLTEASPVVAGNPPFGEDRHGTIGLPYPDTDLRVIDPGTGAPTPFEGEWTLPGEIVVRGPQVMKRYWNRPDETAGQMIDGWLRTGDIGQMHRDGYFKVVDRLKDLIIRSGMKVYPAEVEAVLHEHPKVLQALVIGIPDAMRGELVRAFVVPRPGVAICEAEILDYCAENLAKYKVPSSVEFRAELPKSAVGKPLRRLLREECLAGLTGREG